MKSNTARSNSGYPTLAWEIVEADNSLYLEYEVIAPFVTKGKVSRLSWCWSLDYPRDRLMQEAAAEAMSLSNQMWGEK